MKSSLGEGRSRLFQKAFAERVDLGKREGSPEMEEEAVNKGQKVTKVRGINVCGLE